MPWVDRCRPMAFLAVVAATTVVLSGCILHNGPIAIGTLDGQFRVAVCEELIVDEAFASVVEPGDQWEPLWEATGQTTIPAGTTDFLGEDTLGMTTTFVIDPSFEPGTRFAFTFLGNPNVNDGTIAEFRVPDAGVADGLWLNTEGETSTSPCEGY